MRGLLAAALLVLLACSDTEPAQPSPGGPASVTPRASVIFEPPRLALGDTARVEIAVITPPGWSVRPYAVPDAVDGLWILETSRPVVEQQPLRWIQRMQLRVRARRTGVFAWPTLEVAAVSPDGVETRLATEARPFTVVPVSGEMSPRASPFGYRRPELPGRARSAWLPASLGALGALAALGLVWIVRRARAHASRGELPAPEPGAPWRAAQATLAAAQEYAESDPVRAADMASAAVRLYVARRYRASTLTDTSEELALREPPFGLASRWERLLALLRALDAVRFLPADARVDGPAQEPVAMTIARSRELVIEMAPQGNWR